METSTRFNVIAGIVMVTLIFGGCAAISTVDVNPRAEQQKVDDRRDAQIIQEWVREAENYSAP